MAKNPTLRVPTRALEFVSHPAFVSSLTAKSATEIDGAGDMVTCALRLTLTLGDSDLEEVPLEEGNRSALESVVQGSAVSSTQTIDALAAYPAHQYEIRRGDEVEVVAQGQVIGRKVTVTASADADVIATWRVGLTVTSEEFGRLGALMDRTDVTISTVRVPEPVQGDVFGDGDGGDPE